MDLNPSVSSLHSPLSFSSLGSLPPHQPHRSTADLCCRFSSGRPVEPRSQPSEVHSASMATSNLATSGPKGARHVTNSAGHGLVYDKPRSSGQTMTTDPRPGMSWSSMSCTWGPSRPPAPHRHRRWSLDGTWDVGRGAAGSGGLDLVRGGRISSVLRLSGSSPSSIGWAPRSCCAARPASASLWPPRPKARSTPPEASYQAPCSSRLITISENDAGKVCFF